MFQNIKHGWATLVIEKFTGRCSYLTDPVLDIAEVLINKQGVVEFDEEGSSFELIFLHNVGIYAVSHRKKHKVHPFNISHEEFARQFIKNITENLIAWVEWDDFENDPTFRAERQSKIENAIKSIKEIYKL